MATYAEIQAKLDAALKNHHEHSNDMTVADAQKSAETVRALRKALHESMSTGVEKCKCGNLPKVSIKTPAVTVTKEFNGKKVVKEKSPAVFMVRCAACEPVLEANDDKTQALKTFAFVLGGSPEEAVKKWNAGERAEDVVGVKVTQVKETLEEV